MNTRTIPINRAALVEAVRRAIVGVQTHAATVNIVQNTPAAITVDLHDYIGDPLAAVNNSKVHRLAVARDNFRTAQRDLRDALAAGRKFCADAIDALKAHLGRTWNSRWEAAGFNGFSLAASRGNPSDTLDLLWGYFHANPAREHPGNGITAAAAQTVNNAIHAARSAVSLADGARLVAIQNHDESREKLRRRLRALRDELDLFLSDDDARWRDFGFSRPVDSRIPEVVTGLVLTPSGPGFVEVQFADAPRAENFRVRWAVNNSSPTFTDVGLFTDRTVNLRGLPSGATIIVQVTARNEAGESQPTTATVTVP